MRRWDVWINMKSKTTMKSMEKTTITTEVKNQWKNHDIQEEQEAHPTVIKVEIINALNIFDNH